jgi:hypothetical protein
MISLSIAAALVAGIYLGIDHLLERACPTETFLYGWTNLGGALTTLPWLFCGLICANLVVRSMVYGLPWAAQPGYVISSAVALALAVPLSTYGAFAGFCAWPQGLSIRESSFSPTKTYRWQDVHRVTAICGGGKSHPNFLLSLADNTEIDLWEGPNAFVRNFASVRTALSGIPFAYDKSHVTRGCPPDMRDLFLQWPGSGKT